MAAAMRAFKGLYRQFSTTLSAFINYRSLYYKQASIIGCPAAMIASRDFSEKEKKGTILSGYSSQLLARRTAFNTLSCTKSTLDIGQQSRSISTSSKLNKYYVKPNYLKKWARRDVKRRELFAEHEYERSSLRMIKKSDILPNAIKKKAGEDIAKLPRDSCITKVRNRCVLTDRGRAIVVQYRVSRMMFKYYADRGEISGVTRAWW